MGLDVYVGPLTRYYSGLWKTVVQQAGEAEGFEVRVEYMGATPTRPSADEASRLVTAWQERLGAATGLPMTWPESSDGAYFTDKPDWDGYWAVLFLAASDEFPEVPPPAEVPRPPLGSDPRKHPMMKRAAGIYRPSRPGLIDRLLGRTGDTAPPGPRRYPHLLGLAEVWLPVDFEQPLQTKEAAGNKVTVGSSPRLLRELEDLNSRTLSADDATLESWRQRGPSEDDASLRRVAEFGLAIFIGAAWFSVEKQAPIRLDY